MVRHIPSGRGRRPCPVRLVLEELEGRCLPSTAFLETDLVSDLAGRAKFTDANLVNPWGLSYSPGGEFWVSDNNSGKSTLYDGQGNRSSLVVGIPPPPGSAAGTLGTPTGTVYNGIGSFGGSIFLFDSEDGTISGWSGAANAVVEVNNSAKPTAANGAVYKGLAIGTNAAQQPLLYAANFRAGTIDVFDQTFHATTVSGGFTDPSIPAGYAPFNIEALGGKLYVTYALQNAAKHDDVGGAGHGYVDVFSTDGVLQKQLVAQGNLNSPWGLAIAPAGFGAFSNALLVGNFKDGHVNAYDPSAGTFLGQLDDAGGNPIVIDHLWGLMFGNGGQAGSTTTLYFSGGLNAEADGLFGSLTAIAGKTTTTTQVGASASAARFGQAVTLTATVAPTSGTAQPTGTVTFQDGATVLGTASLAVNNGVDQAVVTLTNLTVASHSVTASYAGDTNFTGGAAVTPAPVTVTAADTTTGLTASTAAEDFGQTVTLTATLAAVSPGAGVPTGNVTFSDGNTVLGTAPLSVDPHTGHDVATLPVANLGVGGHSLTAAYATDGNYNVSDSTNAAVALTVNPAITLPASALPPDTVAISYAQTLTAAGGTGDVTLAVSAISGPTAGLRIPPGGTNTLDLSGAPSGVGTVAFTVTATDTVGGKLVRTYSLVVNPPVSFPTTALPNGSVGVSYAGTIATAGGTGDKQLVVSGVTGAIDGLTIPPTGTNTLALSGKPTATGTVTFTVTATDAVGASQAQQFSVTVVLLSLTPATLPGGTAGTPYHQTVTAAGGTGDVALAVTHLSGTIAGLSVPASGTNTLTIDSTPTGTGTITFTVVATDPSQQSVSADYSITVQAGAPAQAIVLTGPQQLTAGVPSTVMTVQLRDGNGNVAQAGSGGLVLALTSDSSAGHFLDAFGGPLASAQVAIAAGASSASFEYVDTHAGAPTLTASAGFSTSQQEAVVAGSAVRLVVQVADHGSAGATLPIAVAAVDAFGNTDLHYTGTVAVELQDTTVSHKQLGAAAMALVHGAGTFGSFKLGAPGTDMVLAASNSTLLPATASIAVSAAPTFLITLAPAGPGNTGVGQPFNVTVTARAGGATETAYSGTIHLTSSDPQAGLPADLPIAPGAGGSTHFTVILRSAGPQMVTATDVTLATARGTSNSLSITSSLPLTIDHFIVTGMPSSDVLGVQHAVTITAVNAAGQTATGYVGTVQLASGNPTPLSVPFLAADHGVKHVMLALSTLGAQSLTATDANSKTGAEANIDVVSPATQLGVSATANPITAGGQVTVTVTGLISPTRTDTLFADAVQVTPSDPLAVPVSRSMTNGVQKFTFMVATAGAQSFQVTDLTRPALTGPLAHVTVNAGTATQLSITAAPLFALTGARTQVTVMAEDSFGNRVLNGFAGPVTLRGVGADRTHTFVSAIDHGLYQFTVTPTTTGNLTLTTAAGQLTPAAVALTVVSAAVSLAPDPSDPATQALIVLAPAGGTVVITPTDALGLSLAVTINGRTAAGGPFTPTGHLIVYGQGGSTVVNLVAHQGATVDVRAILLAGTGTATLNATGSRAATILVGGPANDTLTAGSGPSIVIGGGGIDTLNAGAGGSILIGGSTAYDTQVAALASLLAEWGQSGLTYTQRVAAMAAGGTDALLLTPQTVTRDQPGNKLNGSTAADWFWLTANAVAADRLNGVTADEVVTAE